jgi:predicted DNA-binding transcriptional regulator YafY
VDPKKLVKQIEQDLDKVSLRIRYRDKKECVTERTITPIVPMMNRDGELLIMAWCHLRQQLRTFYLQHIVSVDPIARKKLDLAKVIRSAMGLPRWEREFVDNYVSSVQPLKRARRAQTWRSRQDEAGE